MGTNSDIWIHVRRWGLVLVAILVAVVFAPRKPEVPVLEFKEAANSLLSERFEATAIEKVLSISVLDRKTGKRFSVTISEIKP